MEPVPVAIATVVGGGMLTAIKVLWSQQAAIRKECATTCAAQLAEKNTEIAALKKEHAAELAALKAEHDQELEERAAERDEFQNRWIREIQHGANLALLPRRPNEPPPDSLPPPEWDEPTQVGQTREEVQRAVLGQRRREFEASSSNMRAVALPETLRRGMRNHSLVARVQAFLRSQNLYRDPVDGDFSVETEAAVKHLQDIAGIPPTGIVDAPTWGALFQAGFQMPSPPRPRMGSRPR